MFGLRGFVICDGCAEKELLEIGLTPTSMLVFDAQALTPEGWQVHLEYGAHNSYCPACVKRLAEEAKRPKLTVVSS